MTEKLIETECAVIGGGLAGCSAAIELAEAGKKVSLFVKGKLENDSNSYLLAGGLAADSTDYESHFSDTLKAGKGLNDASVVRFCVENFYEDVIKWTEKLGVKYDKKDGKYSLHREGGHSKERVYRIQDATGKSVMEILTDNVKNNPNITVYENYMAIDLITKNKIEPIKSEKDECLGFYAYDIDSGLAKTVSCKGTFIATGGLGKVFMYTSNSDIASGDGFAICYRAGLPLANMEFVQIHPTVFYDPNLSVESERRFLLTEALRGAGAILKLSKYSKEDFVLNYHPDGSRSTRDVVTRAEDMEMRKNKLKHVWLDCTQLDEEILKNEFKNSFEFCLSKGVNMANEPVPVVYAAHYSNGGVLTGMNGETKIKGCYVIGETAYTGLHGATRLASNSGSECVLFGRLAAKHYIYNSNEEVNKEVPLWYVGEAREQKDKTTVEYYWDTIRRTMTSMCGVARNEERLKNAKRILTTLGKCIDDFYWDFFISKDFLEVRNIADVANAVLDSALSRKESRACHYREDFPETNDNKYLGLTIVKRGKKPYIVSLKK